MTTQATERTNLTAMSALTFMFFSFGFVTAMNNILIPYMKTLFALTDAESMFINMVWYGAYAVGSIPSSAITEKYGYKRGILTGLVICALGGFLYYPAASLISYPFFLAATFILALGITLLQVAVNPYVVEVGPHSTTAVRMNIVGTAGSTASMIAPIIGAVLFLGTIKQIIPVGIDQLTDIQRVALSNTLQMPYIIIGAAFLLVAVVIAIIKLPVIQHNTDAQGTIGEAWKHRHLRWGVLAIFVYEGLEIAIPSFMVRYASDAEVWGIAQADAAKYVTFYFLAMLIGRFSGIFVMRHINDRAALSIYSIAGIVLVTIGVLSGGVVAIVALVLSGFCQSVMWGNIFGLATKGLDYLTNKATSLMLTAIAGGGIITVGMGTVADFFGVKWAIAIMIPLYCYMIWFALSAEKLSSKFSCLTRESDNQ